jgi:oxygen-independent coproporphyrinogen III oxidase
MSADDVHGVYVHVPFCRRRCPYCDFYFEVQDAAPVADRFAERVHAEIEARAHEWQREPAPSTLSFGGGTPSLLPIAVLSTIVDAVRTTMRLRGDAEISIEVNPEDNVDGAALKSIGITRVSIGAQSLHDDVLRYLGRKHTADDVARTIDSCTTAGLDVSVDLIVGVPGQDSARIEEDMRSVAARGVVHISAYVLTVEEGTPLVQLIASGRRKNIDDDHQADALLLCQELLPRFGYAQYEVSNHARAGYESRHNRLYWQHRPTFAVGPGAHSFRIDVDGKTLRRKNAPDLAQYLGGGDVHDVETLAGVDAVKEAVAFGMRDVLAGVDVGVLARMHGVDERECAGIVAALHAAVRQVMAFVVFGRFHLTPDGLRFADRVARAVLR